MKQECTEPMNLVLKIRSLKGRFYMPSDFWCLIYLEVVVASGYRHFLNWRHTHNNNHPAANRQSINIEDIRLGRRPKTIAWCIPALAFNSMSLGKIKVWHWSSPHVPRSPDHICIGKCWTLEWRGWLLLRILRLSIVRSLFVWASPLKFFFEDYLDARS